MGPGSLDYYFTVKDGLGVEDAERVFEEFERTHYAGWDLKIYIREYVFLYVAHFGTNHPARLAVPRFAGRKLGGFGKGLNRDVHPAARRFFIRQAQEWSQVEDHAAVPAGMACPPRRIWRCRV